MSRAIRLKLRLPWHVRLWQIFVWALCILLMFVVVIGGLYSFLTLQRFKVTGVTVSGGTSTSRALLHERVTAHLATPSMWLASRDSVFTLKKDDMAAAIQGSFPQLKHVDVRWSGKTDISISLTDRIPQYTFATSSALYFADENSYIYAQASSTGTEDLFELSGGILDVPLGKTILTQGELTWLSLLRNDLSQMHVILTGATLRSDGDIDCITEEGWILKTNINRDGRSLARSLSSVFRALPSDDSRESLAYIDLRFPGKAYFRLHDNRSATSTPSIP